MKYLCIYANEPFASGISLSLSNIEYKNFISISQF